MDLTKELNVSESVRFMGYVHHGPDLFELYRQTDIFLLPSFHEGIPNAILEAMAHSMPIVTTNVGGLSSVITDGVEGILISAGNLDAVTARRLFAHAQADRQQLIGEIRDGKPDIILVDTRPGRIVADNRVASWSEWVQADRELSALIAANYREVDNAEGVAILKRNGT